MEIKVFQTGPIEVNTYIIFDKDTKDCAVFDIGGQVEYIADFIKNNNLKLNAIYATHGHFDHIFGAKELQEKFDVPFYISEADAVFAENLPAQLKMYGLNPASPPKINGFLKENDEFYIGKQKVKILETPGHTIGGLCFLFDNILLSGDTLFLESVGRTDLPTGDFSALQKSVKEKLFKLDDTTKVLPGHGPSTSIGHEKANNFYV